MDCIDENNRRSYWSEEAESCCRSDRETGFGTHVVVTGGNTCPPKKPQAPMLTHYAQGPATLMVECGLLKCVHDTSKGYKPLH